jgi:hypothetical protein
MCTGVRNGAHKQTVAGAAIGTHSRGITSARYGTISTCGEHRTGTGLPRQWQAQQGHDDVRECGMLELTWLCRPMFQTLNRAECSCHAAQDCCLLHLLLVLGPQVNQALEVYPQHADSLDLKRQLRLQLNAV